MKLSLITATFNSENLIADNLRSVINQKGSFELEHVIQDGCSSDKTLQLIRNCELGIKNCDLGYEYQLQLISERDSGFYDAINKGIERSTGDIVGLLNSDDFYASDGVLGTVVKAFEENPEVKIVFGDLDYVKVVPITEDVGFKIQDNNPKEKEGFVTEIRGQRSDPASVATTPRQGSKTQSSSAYSHQSSAIPSHLVTRRWRSGPASLAKFRNGWMPAHPTVYVRRKVYEEFGGYRLDMGTAADYEWMLRILGKHQLPSLHIPKVFVKMRVGGISNENMNARLNANQNDRKAWEVNGLKPNPWFRIAKPLRKIPQWIF